MERCCEIAGPRSRETFCALKVAAVALLLLGLVLSSWSPALAQQSPRTCGDLQLPGQGNPAECDVIISIVADATGTEGTDATIDFEVSLNKAHPNRDVTVKWSTESHTGISAATAGEDYTAASGTLTFRSLSGETTKTVSITLGLTYSS